nr:hypothetical protein [Tanacetum cinerariifolium]
MPSSIVTYTLISSDYEEPSDAGSHGVVVYRYDGLPMHPVDPYVEATLQAPGQAPPFLDYVPGLEHPPFLDYVPDLEEPEQALVSPVYVHEPEYLEYLVLSDAEASMEDQPLPDDASPTALSPSYVADSDSEEDLEEDLEKNPVDGGDDDDDDQSSDDDDDDDDVEDDEKDEEEKEEEERLALADSSVVPIDDIVPSAENIKAFETDESATTPPPPPDSVLLLGCLSEPKYLYCFLLRQRFEIKESSSATAARQAGHTLAHRVYYGFVDTIDVSIYAAESRAMTVIGVVNDRDDRALLGAQVSILRRERRYFSLMPSSYECKAVIARRKMPLKKRTVTTITTTTPMIDAQIKALIAQGVADALAKHDADRSKNGDDSHDSGSDGKRRMPVARECTYSDFLKCQPLNFTGTERVGNALMWWNSHVKTVTHEWNDMESIKKDDEQQYVGGLPDMIHRSVMESKPKTMNDAIEFATELMDQKIHTLAERQAENKRKFEDTSRNNQNQQQPFKRHNVAQAYTVGPEENKLYRGS